MPGLLRWADVETHEPPEVKTIKKPPGVCSRTRARIAQILTEPSWIIRCHGPVHNSPKTTRIGYFYSGLHGYFRPIRLAAAPKSLHCLQPVRIIMIIRSRIRQGPHAAVGSGCDEAKRIMKGGRRRFADRAFCRAFSGTVSEESGSNPRVIVRSDRAVRSGE